MKRLLATFVWATLAISVAGNIILYRTALHFYLREEALRLHPIHSAPSNSTGNPTGRKVLLLGDSRCFQWPKNFPAEWRMINAGVGNETTEQIRLRTVSVLAETHPEVIIIEAGINDLKTLPLFPRQKRQIIDDCFQHILSLVEEGRRRNAAVVVLSIWPAGRVEWSRKLLWSEDVPLAVTEVNQHLAQSLAYQAHVRFVDLTDQIHPEEDYVDTLHFNSAFYERITPLVVTAAEDGLR